VFTCVDHLPWRYIVQDWKALFAVLYAISFAACSSSIELSSKAVDRPLSIDGDDAQWHGKTVLVDDGKISLGFQNDSMHLFVYFRTTDLSLQSQIMMGGLTVWFDSTGGKTKYSGIRFPLGSEGLQDFRGSMSDPAERERQIERRLAEFPPECEVIGSANSDRQRVPMGTSSGIDGRMRFLEGVLVYELRVPLERGAHEQYAVGWQKDSEIGVVFETRVSKRRERNMSGPPRSAPDGERGGRPPGGMRGGGQRPEGRGIRGRGFEPLDLWVTVKLVSFRHHGQD
jgi:hypothetical protein